jgi:hypothetical protein
MCSQNQDFIEAVSVISKASCVELIAKMDFLIYINLLCVLQELVKYSFSQQIERQYFIETAPYKLCTFHLKTFAKHWKYMKVFEEIVNDNQDEHVIWTVWTGDANSTVEPTIHFHERCTANIVIEQGSRMGTKDVFVYIAYDQLKYK